jgi:hypothetical protein
MDRSQLSSPSGDGDRASDSEDRVLDRRPQGGQPGWPVWAQISQVSPWEAVEIPDAPLIRPAAADEDPDAGEGADDLIERFLLWGRDRGLWEGGVLPMRRLITALTTLATLFVVASAGLKWG